MPRQRRFDVTLHVAIHISRTVAPAAYKARSRPYQVSSLLFCLLNHIHVMYSALNDVHEMYNVLMLYMMHCVQIQGRFKHLICIVCA